MIYEVVIEGAEHRIEVERREAAWVCRIDGREWMVDAVRVGADTLSLLVAGRSYEIRRERRGAETQIWIGGRRFRAEVRDLRSLRGRRTGDRSSEGPAKMLAAMPGKVLRILRSVDESVEAGQGILVVEAMKMQNELKSPKSGRVQKILVAEGAIVNAGDVLAIVE
jgi:biotin carboxyl carrier protein